MEVRRSRMRGTAAEMSATDPQNADKTHEEHNTPEALGSLWLSWILFIRSRLDLITANKWRYKSLNSKIAGAVRRRYDKSAPPQLHPVASNKTPSGRDMDSGGVGKKIVLF